MPDCSALCSLIEAYKDYEDAYFLSEGTINTKVTIRHMLSRDFNIYHRSLSLLRGTRNPRALMPSYMTERDARELRGALRSLHEVIQGQRGCSPEVLMAFHPVSLQVEANVSFFQAR